VASLHEITRQAGAHPRRKRVGRGESSGRGKTCGRGHKGCQSRSGGGVRPLSEGGQMPIFRRLAKRGFSNFHFRTEFQQINLKMLNDRFSDGDTVNGESLAAAGLIDPDGAPIKILAKGAIERKLTVEAHAFSQSAREAIEKAGGSVKPIDAATPAAKAQAKRKTAAKKKSAGRPKRGAPSPRLAKKRDMKARAAAD
jgi:large subunit ribosomal protein L15